MKLIRVTFVVSALTVLAGCAADPVNQGGNFAGPPSEYDSPAPASSAPRVYREPNLGLGMGISGGGRPHSRGYGYR